MFTFCRMLAAFSVFFLPTGAVFADVVLTASGANTFSTNEFFFVEVTDLPAGLTVNQILIDLQGGTNTTDFWDTDQFGGNSPWGFRNGTGITSGDVTFDPAAGTGPPHSSILDITFASGTFDVGDSFTFDFDTDFIITDGDEFGQFGVTVSLFLSDGSTFNTAFVDDGIGNDFSEARFLLTSVPEPTSLLLASAIAMGIGLNRRRRCKLG